MGNETKINLIKNAKNLFAKRGFYGVSLASIAEKTGVSKQACFETPVFSAIDARLTP